MKRLPILLVVLSLILTGCSTITSRRLSIVFEDLGSEVQTRHGDDDVNYRVSINITGISSPQPTGMLITVPGKSIPDNYAMLIGTDSKSKIVEQVYETNASLDDVANLRNGLQDAMNKMVSVAEQEIRIAVLEAATKIGKDQLKETTEAYAAIGRIFNADNVDNKKVEELLAENRQELLKRKKEADDLKSELTKLTKKKNLIITRWTAANGGTLASGVSDMLGISVVSERTIGGFLIMAGIRTSTLMVGGDVKGLLRNNRTPDTITSAALPFAVVETKSGMQASDLFKDVFLVTYRMGAKYLAYAESMDYSRHFSTSLRLTQSELMNLFGGSITRLLRNKIVEIDASLHQSINSLNQGVVEAPRRRVYDFSLENGEDMFQSGLAEIARSRGYQDVYVIRNSMMNIEDKTPTTTMISGSVSLGLGSMEQATPSKEFRKPIPDEFAKPIYEDP